MTTGSRKPAIAGTNEWAVRTVNCVNGCPHTCRYCYAADIAVRRFHRSTCDEWGTTYYHVRWRDVKKPAKPLDGGTVMFPSTHDILPSVLDACLELICRQLAVGNRLLIVSKPHLECIQRICDECVDYRDMVLFRFTIGAFNNAILTHF